MGWAALSPSGTPIRQERGFRPLGHQPVLDGVRGLAWLAVFVGHAAPAQFLATGQVAMFVWFGLSGFLISSLLVGERSKTGTLSLGNFYARRALRLLPALGLFLLAWLAMVAVFGHEPWMTTVPHGGHGTGEPFGIALQGVGAAAGYVTNWFDIFHVFSGYVPLGHLWSLAVEEQFYLVWAPLLWVMLAARKGRVGVPVIGAVVLAAGSFADVVFLQHAHDTTRWVFFGTDTRAGAFLVGGALGLMWSAPTVSRLWVRMCTPIIVVALGVMLAAGWVFGVGHPVPAWLYDLNWIAVSVSGPMLVVALVDRRRRAGPSFLCGGFITYVGRRSYALYLWHYVWLTWMRDVGPAGVVIAFVASFACAEISWRLVEAPALSLKRRLGAARAAPPEEGVPRGGTGQAPLSERTPILRPELATSGVNAP